MWNRFKRWIRSIFRPTPTERPDQAIEPDKRPDTSAGVDVLSNNIMTVCNELMDKVHEIPGDEHNPVIVEMLRTVTGKDYPDETPWCAAAVGYVLNRVGLDFSTSLLARSYLNYGTSVSSLHVARKGDILVFERDNSSWKGHVGFYSGYHTNDQIEVIGGNQNNGFNRKYYPKKELIGIRRPVITSVNRQNTRSHFNKYEFSKDFYVRLTELCYELAETRPSDIMRYVNKYPQMSKEKKMHFWTFFLSCMAMRESGVNPKTRYTESFRDSRGRKVISRGLFQTSIESVNGYRRHGYEGINSYAELHDPITNLEGAVFILKHWIERDGQISSNKSPWRGGARYWSVLRNNDSHRWIINECNKWSKQNA